MPGSIVVVGGEVNGLVGGRSKLEDEANGLALLRFDGIVVIRVGEHDCLRHRGDRWRRRRGRRRTPREINRFEIQALEIKRLRERVERQPRTETSQPPHAAQTTYCTNTSDTWLDLASGTEIPDIHDAPIRPIRPPRLAHHGTRSAEHNALATLFHHRHQRTACRWSPHRRAALIGPLAHPALCGAARSAAWRKQ